MSKSDAEALLNEIQSKEMPAFYFLQKDEKYIRRYSKLSGDGQRHLLEKLYRAEIEKLSLKKHGFNPIRVALGANNLNPDQRLFNLVVCGTLTNHSTVSSYALEVGLRLDTGSISNATFNKLKYLKENLEKIDEPWVKDCLTACGIPMVNQFLKQKLEAMQRGDPDAANGPSPDSAAAPSKSIDKFEVIQHDKVPYQDALRHLTDIIGLNDIKKRIYGMVIRSSYDKARAQATKRNEGGRFNNIILSGPPGVGKTTLSRIAGELLSASGLLPEKKTIFAISHQLIGPYTGHTEKNIEQLMAVGRGGIIVLDEFDRLAQGSKTSFQESAIDFITALVSHERNINSGTVFVLSGYPDGITALLNANEGLARRFPYRFEIEPYSIDTLCKIMQVKTKARDYTITPNALTSVSKILGSAQKRMGKKFGNAGSVEDILELMIDAVSQSLEANYIADTLTGQITPETFLERTRHLTAQHVPSFNYRSGTFEIARPIYPNETQPPRTRGKLLPFPKKEL
ncbi:MAG: AAA family ATPase [Bdellovibrionales bacterium]|jgi:Holliday junction resolvasome RuvABC ATP-dependent DNA helicase subunit